MKNIYNHIISVDESGVLAKLSKHNEKYDENNFFILTFFFVNENKIKFFRKKHKIWKNKMKKSIKKFVNHKEIKLINILKLKSVKNFNIAKEKLKNYLLFFNIEKNFKIYYVLVNAIKKKQKIFFIEKILLFGLNNFVKKLQNEKFNLFIDDFTIKKKDIFIKNIKKKSKIKNLNKIKFLDSRDEHLIQITDLLSSVFFHQKLKYIEKFKKKHKINFKFDFFENFQLYN